MLLRPLALQHARRSKMKKLILLAVVAAMAVPTVAGAQRQQDVRNDRAAVRQHRRDVRQDRRDVRQDRRALRSDRRDVRQDRRAVRRARSAYVAPVRNWNYRRVSVGYRLQPAFYGSRYYINDYGAYHLRAPHGRWLRWIRYGNDLLLVNVRTGRVLDVVHYRGW
jgi:Ni/Co efflux regulator RcnB